MNRSQRRAYKKEAKSREIDIEKLRKEIIDEAKIEFMLGSLALPMMVLMDHFWKSSYRQKIPQFTELLLEYYQDWENGLLDSDKMAEDLWNYGGVRLERNE